MYSLKTTEIGKFLTKSNAGWAMYIRFILENAIVRITASGKMTSFCAYTTRVFRNVSAIFNFFFTKCMHFNLQETGSKE